MVLQPDATATRVTRAHDTPLSLGAMTPRRPTLLLAALTFVLAGCDAGSPVQATHHGSHEGGLALSSLTRASDAPVLAALTRLTAPFHDVDMAIAAGYGLFVAPPRTAPDGCISSAQDGGMGYHYGRFNNLGDDSVSLLDPEFLVYAPKQGAGNRGTRLAAFDYFIPYSPKWPGPSQAGFTRAPTLHDFSTMRDLPDVAFAPSRFDGWMVHIWLWENNPGGLFANWNSAVPLCQGSTF